MKKFIIAASLIFLGLGSAFAQQGKQAVGGSLSYGTETESVGIGAKYQYNITNEIRIEPSMDYFFKHNGLSMFDINANVHYLVPIASNVKIYPLAGFTFTSWHQDLGIGAGFGASTSKFGVNLGAKDGEGWRLLAVLKKMLADNNIDIRKKMAEWRKK